MAGYEGMDTDVLRGVAQRLRGEGARLDVVIGEVQRSVDEALTHWSGGDAHGFNNWWVSHYRPALTAAHQALVEAANTVDRNIADQDRASGVGGAGGGAGTSPMALANGLNQLGLPLDAAQKLFGERFLPRAADGTWMSPSQLSQLEREMAAMDKDSFLVKNGWAAHGLHNIAKPLGPLGIGLDLNDMYQGHANHDVGQQLTGTTGLVGAAAPFPFNIAVGGALAYGGATIPVTNDEQDGTIQLAMQTRFGSSYDPNNMTMEQSGWLVDHYSGVGGFFNSISDGMNYKAETFADGVGNAWNGFTGWVSGR